MSPIIPAANRIPPTSLNYVNHNTVIVGYGSDATAGPFWISMFFKMNRDLTFLVGFIIFSFFNSAKFVGDFLGRKGLHAHCRWNQPL